MRARACGAGTDARFKIVLRLKIAFVGQVVYREVEIAPRSNLFGRAQIENIEIRRNEILARDDERHSLARNGRSEIAFGVALRSLFARRRARRNNRPGDSMVKVKGTVVVINLSVAPGCPVAKRGSQPEKNKTAGEKRDSDVRPGDTIRPITQMAAYMSKTLYKE
jgi:hypothetical protein